MLPHARSGQGPDLEEEKNSLVVQNAKHNKILKDIEDGVLLCDHRHGSRSFLPCQCPDSFVVAVAHSPKHLGLRLKSWVWKRLLPH